MKITTTRQSLLDALLVVSRAVSARAALQALSGILITTDGGATLRATDMELGSKASRVRSREADRSSPGRPRRGGPLLPDGSVTLPFARPSATSRSARDLSLPSSHPVGERLPALPRVGGRGGRLPAAPLRDTINRVAAPPPATRLARFSPASSSPSRATDDDGRHRLLSPRREDHEALDLGAGAPRGERPGASAAGARPAGRGRRGGTAAGVAG